MARQTNRGEHALQWSFSRREALERCPRAYYYHYYGASLRSAKADPLKPILRFLKRLQSRYLRSGDLAHLVIRTYLKHVRAGDVWSRARVLNWARTLYRQDCQFSQQYRRGDALPDDPRAPVLLLEFYYGAENALSQWEETEQRLIAALDHFMTSPELAHFRSKGETGEALIEKPVSVRGTGFTFRGQMDLAYRDERRVVVVDWKTGGSQSTGDNLQLLSYALAALQEFSCTPSDIDLYRIHLAETVVSPFSVSEHAVNNAHARIVQDLERMQMIDSYGREGVSEAFTPCGQPRICSQCAFQEICPKE